MENNQNCSACAVLCTIAHTCEQFSNLHVGLGLDFVLLSPLEQLRGIVMSTSVSVCLSVSLYVCPRAYLPNHTHDLYQLLCMLPMTVARSSSGGVTKSQGERAIFGGKT